MQKYIKMGRLFIYFSLLIMFIFVSKDAKSQIISISTSVEFTDATGNTTTESTISASAPIVGHFSVEAENAEGWDVAYKWVFTYMNVALLTRYGNETEYTFTDFGEHKVHCEATFSRINPYSGQKEIVELSTIDNPYTISPLQSILEMPNAFSPNGDGTNDIYKPKSGYQSIIEFHGYIFNRHGQKLYEWTNPEDGWDGTFNGKDVKDGVYFCLVKAKGADGRVFEIKRDVNLMRGFTTEENIY